MQHDQILQNGGASPFAAYRVLSTTFNAGLVALAATTTLMRRFKLPLSPIDLVTFGIAAHKIAVIVTKERVTMPLRSPFTAQSDHGRGGGHESVPQGRGMKRALGELLTCPHCVAPWIALGLVAGHVVAPLPTRAITTLFTTVALADAFHHGYAWLEAKAKGAEEQSAPQAPARGNGPVSAQRPGQHPHA